MFKRIRFTFCLKSTLYCLELKILHVIPSNLLWTMETRVGVGSSKRLRHIQKKSSSILYFIICSLITIRLILNKKLAIVFLYFFYLCDPILWVLLVCINKKKIFLIYIYLNFHVKDHGLFERIRISWLLISKRFLSSRLKAFFGENAQGIISRK